MQRNDEQALTRVPPASLAARGARPITILEPERMNLLGLMLRGLLERGLAAGRGARLRGDILVEAGGMRITLRFGEDRVEITREPPRGRPRARVCGTLTALCDAALERGRVRAWFGGRLSVRGGPLTLWRLLVLLRAS